MGYSWHQQQRIKREGAPDYAATDGTWSVVSGRDSMSVMKGFPDRASAEAYLNRVQELHGEDGWIVAPEGVG